MRDFTTQLAAHGPHSWGPWGSGRVISSFNAVSPSFGFRPEETVSGLMPQLCFLVFVCYKLCLPPTSGFQRKDASVSQPGPQVPEPQGGRGQGGPPEENADILLRRRRVERPHSLTVDGR